MRIRSLPTRQANRRFCKSPKAAIIEGGFDGSETNTDAMGDPADVGSQEIAGDPLGDPGNDVFADSGFDSGGDFGGFGDDF